MASLGVLSCTCMKMVPFALLVLFCPILSSFSHRDWIFSLKRLFWIVERGIAGFEKDKWRIQRSRTPQHPKYLQDKRKPQSRPTMTTNREKKNKRTNGVTIIFLCPQTTIPPKFTRVTYLTPHVLERQIAEFPCQPVA